MLTTARFISFPCSPHLTNLPSWYSKSAKVAATMISLYALANKLVLFVMVRLILSSFPSRDRRRMVARYRRSPTLSILLLISSIIWLVNLIHHGLVIYNDYERLKSAIAAERLSNLLSQTTSPATGLRGLRASDLERDILMRNIIYTSQDAVMSDPWLFDPITRVLMISLWMFLLAEGVFGIVVAVPPLWDFAR
ncbi:uncharacterized protein BO97DRAFT_413974 [Aspergillus homomorphus CBS 101889]|uniref:Uncharacterized protein n=1 Tax=Aspergillus homomorphus (strain CBS 101889) TaxID=1450537 RepID=A0A395I0E8_ASPHC|nr:hypothetical protein BO97DRAFT_413974 [Aspergillus homomorphus CBS 101889]RAL12608.1 hypothetical protein BO97DRAFT_413974 [Aspergillus homomorphus CBS 101889]